MTDEDRTEPLPPDDESTQPLPSSDPQPVSIGSYRILQKLGEGGMGVVYEAEQQEPVRRRVALKVIKHGMDTAQVIARFEAERQALALMDHPNVAKVFDAGSTERGRPYFAMEYIRGVPITEFCDRQRLTTRERLELFRQVCEGVQHAHQNAIIHRDIKPSNILVTTQDGRRVPKIIDFGVAKATAQRLTERTVFTALGQLIGTPEYMSPEQAEMTPESVDTRTDVYSLGVLLYELLVGALPFDSGELRRAGFDEVRRKIREEEPPRPSTRVSTLGDASGEAAARRHTDPRTLVRMLRGDLDWITMKCLEKDRTRRYASASEFAADIARHLKNEPVLAGPPGSAYRMKKFLRRNKEALFSLGCLLAAVAALSGVVAYQHRQFSRLKVESRVAVDGAVREAFHLWADVLEPAPVDHGFEHDIRGVKGVAHRAALLGRMEGVILRSPQAATSKASVLRNIGSEYGWLRKYDDALRVLEQAHSIDPKCPSHPVVEEWRKEQLRLGQGLGTEDRERLETLVEIGSHLGLQRLFLPIQAEVRDILTHHFFPGCQAGPAAEEAARFLDLIVSAADEDWAWSSSPGRDAACLSDDTRLEAIVAEIKALLKEN